MSPWWHAQHTDSVPLLTQAPTLLGARSRAVALALARAYNVLRKRSEGEIPKRPQRPRARAHVHAHAQITLRARWGATAGVPALGAPRGTYNQSQATPPPVDGTAPPISPISYPWLEGASLSILRASSMTHNFAITWHAGEWYAVGGRHNRMHDHLALNSPLQQPREAKALARRLHVSPSTLQTPRVGLWMVRGRSWRFEGTDDATHGLDELAADPAVPSTTASTPTATTAHATAMRTTTGRRARSSVAPAPSAAIAHPSSHSRPWLTAKGGIDEPPVTQWRDKTLLFDGLHPGCIERRDVEGSKDFRTYMYTGGVCEFDGRLALVRFGDEFLLYARANLASHGKRHVQVTRSADPWGFGGSRVRTAAEAHALLRHRRRSTDMAAHSRVGGVSRAWSPFEPVHIDGYDESGDIYFFGVQARQWTRAMRPPRLCPASRSRRATVCVPLFYPPSSPIAVQRASVTRPLRVRATGWCR